jgi:ATP-dependent Lon protease
MRIDSTYADVEFSYTNKANKVVFISTLEEDQYANNDHQVITEGEELATKPSEEESPAIIKPETILKEGQLIFKENQKGASFDQLFAPYLKGSKKITITDPYIRVFHQARNLMELMETIAKNKPDEDEIKVHLITSEDEFRGYQQNEFFEKIQEACSTIGIKFTWEFKNMTIHARHIITDHGWKILLDRGLDVFQTFEMNDAFSFANRLQQYRSCKGFEIIYLKI